MSAANPAVPSTIPASVVIAPATRTNVTAKTNAPAQVVFPFTPFGATYQRVLFVVQFDTHDGNMVLDTTELGGSDMDQQQNLVCPAGTQKSYSLDDLLRSHWRLSLYSKNAPVSATWMITGIPR